MPVQRNARGRLVSGGGTGGRPTSDGVRFRILNIQKIQKRLLELEPKVQRKVIRQALRKAAKPVQARAKQLVPRGPTGQSKKNVKVRAMRGTRRGTIGVRVQIGAGDYVGETFYASFFEFGTKRSGKGYLGRGTKPIGQPAQHPMERAYEQTDKEARRIAVQEIAAGIEREAQK